MSAESLTEEAVFLMDPPMHLGDIIRDIRPRTCLVEHDDDDFDREVQQMLAAEDTGDTEMVRKRIREICWKYSKDLDRSMESRDHIALEIIWKSRAERESTERKRRKAEEARDKRRAEQTIKIMPPIVEVTYPVILSLSRLDQTLRKTCVKRWMDSISAYKRMSIDDDNEAFSGMDDLLIEWLGDNSVDDREKAQIASLLVALACAKASISTPIKVILALRTLLPKDEILPVGRLVGRLNKCRLMRGDPPAILGRNHIRCWAAALEKTTKDSPRQSVASCGEFLYVAMGTSGLAKIGTGTYGCEGRWDMKMRVGLQQFCIP